MNKERELLREIYADLEYDSKLPLWLRDRVRDCLSSTSDDAEEPVAWMFQHEDTGLIDFVDTQQVEWGFEKNNPRWQKIGPLYLHPPRPAETEAETIETLKAENFKLASGQCTEGGPWGDKGGTPYCKYAKRKPMTAKEMLKGIDANTYPYEEVLAFVTGIRYAEKHHGITDADV